MDMRKSARVYGSFPVRMRGFDESRCVFKANSLVDNISAGGLYMQVGRPVGEGSRLFAVVQLVKWSDHRRARPRVARRAAAPRPVRRGGAFHAHAVAPRREERRHGRQTVPGSESRRRERPALPEF